MLVAALLRRFAFGVLTILHFRPAPQANISAETPSASGQFEGLLLSVGSYIGDITILKYDPNENSLSKVSAYRRSNFAPSWQTVHPEHPEIIYSTDEGNPGGIVSFRLDRTSGNLAKLARSDGINGTVSIAIQDDLMVVAA
ncbi:hypothetical protein ABW19_dt0201088 [Dactylella cylindrospora]|nr:hypothetical protein ABW19_dt0201088 [Dactylella cylindrospora]